MAEVPWTPVWPRQRVRHWACALLSPGSVGQMRKPRLGGILCNLPKQDSFSPKWRSQDSEICFPCPHMCHTDFHIGWAGRWTSPYSVGQTSLQNPFFFFRISAIDQKLQLVVTQSVLISTYFYKLNITCNHFGGTMINIKRYSNLYFHWVLNIGKVGEMYLHLNIISCMKFSWQ